MSLLLISFIAGALTVLAPCVLPVLPIIVGGAAQNHTKRNPYVITASLAVAIVLFTLILKFSTAFINIPQSVWNILSGTVIILFGVTSLFPGLWEWVNNKLGLSSRSDQLLNVSAKQTSRWGDVLIGLSLGPVFSSCSPTYFVILATVLPRSLSEGTLYLIAYALGLALVLLLVSLLGQRFIRGARWAADPRGWFKRGLGVLFILVGIFIITGADKKVQVYIIEKGFYSVAKVEQMLLQKVPATNSAPAAISESAGSDAILKSIKKMPRYREIVKPAGFVNSGPIKIGDLIGKKVVIVEFMTYSCINCIRTFPYLNAWYEKYKDQGLEIIGIHTPEFAFEHKIQNVEAAMKRYGIKFPVVLDNDYATWNAYGNNYWPRKYIIDIDGYIAYDHIGEGDYDETEMKIQELLNEKMQRDKISGARSIPVGFVSPTGTEKGPVGSPETYLGASRMEYYFPGRKLKIGKQSLEMSGELPLNSFNLGGEWTIEDEKSVAGAGATLQHHFSANKVFLVLRPGSNVSGTVKVYLDGKLVGNSQAGADVKNGVVTVDTDRLYNLIDLKGKPGDHILKLEFETPGVEAFAFTFG